MIKSGSRSQRTVGEGSKPKIVLKTQYTNAGLLTSSFHKVALFLFPKFKSMSILPSFCHGHVHDLVRRLLQTQDFSGAQSDATSDHCYVTEPSTKKRKSDHVEHKSYALQLDEYVDKVQDRDCTDEVARYVEADFSFNDSASCKDHVVDFHVLKFWEEQKVSYPKLAKLARWILAIPPSSASSERVFSCSGRAYEERRSRLSPESLDATVFLNSFFKSSD